MRRFLSLPLLLCAVPAFAQFAPPLGAHPDVAGPRTQLATLGSAHLSGHSGEWREAWLEPLRARLASWQPQAITVEALSGAQCESMRHDPARYGDIYETYCWDMGEFQRTLKMTQPEAEAEAERRLRAWPASPTPAQRRDQAMLFVAAGDLPSACVQWQRLPESERHAGDTLTEAAAKRLARSPDRLNESYDVACRVAARLGLERVYSVDDHTSDALFADMDPAFEPWQGARYDAIARQPAAQGYRTRETAVRDGETLLAYFRDINTPRAWDAQLRMDFGGALSDPHPKRFGRLYVAWWETRNLRMAANIRAVIATMPGARVLNIVGASHKPWYDQWARQMSDVEVVDSQTLLGR